MAERQLERFASIHRPAFRVGAAQTTQAPRTVGGPFDRMLGGAELVQNEQRLEHDRQGQLGVEAGAGVRINYAKAAEFVRLSSQPRKETDR